MPAWPTISRTPPSQVYPPDNRQEYFARTDIPQAIQTSGRNGAVTILELRGWLTFVDERANNDPDFHYDLEVDPTWLSQIGVSPEALFRPGDLFVSDDPDPAQARHRYGPASIHCEVDAFPRSDLRGSIPTAPADWVVSLKDKCDNPNAVWPWDPRLDVHGKSLAVGQYVRIVGSLVTDQPHEQSAVFWTNLVLRTGLGSTKAALDAAHATDPSGVPDAAAFLRAAAANAAKWIWEDGSASSDPTNPARWTELHSPDFIEILDPPDAPDPASRHRFYHIALCAQNGLFSGDTEQFSANLPGPPNRPANSVLRWRHIPTVYTNQSTVVVGPTFTVADDHLFVNVIVQGQAGLARPGKYYELIELWWEVSLEHLSVANVTVVGDRPSQVTVVATDVHLRTPIVADVLIDGVKLGVTGTPFTHTFGTHVAWYVAKDAQGRPSRAFHRVPDPFEAIVRAPGYFDARVPITVIPPENIAAGRKPRPEKPGKP